MATLPILTGADTAVLRSKTEKVAKVTKDVLKLIKDMEVTVHAADGLGLAAPQVGNGQSICLAKFNNKMNPLINPHITWKSEETDIAEEGCLSLPDVFVDVPRAKEIIITYMDAKGQNQERKLSNLDARVVQHEVDHLNGVLIVDYKK